LIFGLVDDGFIWIVDVTFCGVTCLRNTAALSYEYGLEKVTNRQCLEKTCLPLEKGYSLLSPADPSLEGVHVFLQLSDELFSLCGTVFLGLTFGLGLTKCNEIGAMVFKKTCML
jgi:hypothetical protein